MVADGTKGISSTPSTQQTNLDDWKKMVEQRGAETLLAKGKWEGAKTVWNTTWKNMQTNWSNLLTAKNTFGVFFNNKVGLETKQEDLIKEMNFAIRVAQDNARKEARAQALREGKTEDEANEIANKAASTAGDNVRSDFMTKLTNASFKLTKLMPAFTEKQDLLDVAQHEYSKSRLDNNGAQFDVSFYGRQFADASKLELQAEQNLAIAETVVGKNVDTNA